MKIFESKKLVIGLLIVVGAGFWFKKDSIVKPISKKLEANRVASVLEADRVLLLADKAPESDVFTALVRLANRKNPVAKEQALKRLTDPSVLVRRGVASALGYFFPDADATEALATLFNDKDDSVRIAALRALSDRGGPGRLEYLQKLSKEKYALGATTVSEHEREAVWAGVLKLSQGPERLAGVDPLLKLYSQSKDATLRYHVILDLLAQMPRDPRTITLLKNDALKSKDLQILALAVRHVANLRNRELAKSFQALAQSEFLPVRMAVVQSLAKGCPEARFEIMEKVIDQERSADVRKQVFSQMSMLGGREAEAFAEKALTLKNLKSDERALLEKARAQILKNGAAGDSCRL